MKMRDIIDILNAKPTLTEERVTVWSGATINVLRNPSRPAFEEFAKKHEVLRGLLSPDGRTVWLWAAAAAVHPNIMQELGLGNYACIFYNRGRWQGPNIVDYETGKYQPALERLSPKPVDPNEKDKIDDLLRQLYDDPVMAKLLDDGRKP